MEKAELRRHSFVFLTPQGKEALEDELRPAYSGEASERLREIFSGPADIPGIVRRAEPMPGRVAVGFVPYRRLADGNRLRVAAYAPWPAVREIRPVYDAAKGDWPTRNRCMKAAKRLRALADAHRLAVGFLGSVGLEIVTGLPYTDDASDIDLLLRPAPCARLQAFYAEAGALGLGAAMDFEVELPNGYGVKLAELFMDTRTVLGKSLDDVTLLDKKQVSVFLE